MQGAWHAVEGLHSPIGRSAPPTMCPYASPMMFHIGTASSMAVKTPRILPLKEETARRLRSIDDFGSTLPGSVRSSTQNNLGSSQGDLQHALAYAAFMSTIPPPQEPNIAHLKHVNQMPTRPPEAFAHMPMMNKTCDLNYRFAAISNMMGTMNIEPIKVHAISQEHDTTPHPRPFVMSGASGGALLPPGVVVKGQCKLCQQQVLNSDARYQPTPGEYLHATCMQKQQEKKQGAGNLPPQAPKMKPAQPPPPPTIHAQLAWGTGPHDGNTCGAPRVSSIHAQLAGCPGISISKLESLLTTDASALVALPLIDRTDSTCARAASPPLLQGLSPLFPDLFPHLSLLRHSLPIKKILKGSQPLRGE